MISLSKFLQSGADAPNLTYIRAIGLLIQGIELHALEVGEETHASFRAEMTALHERLSPQLPPADVLRLTGEVLKALELHNRLGEEQLQGRFEELYSIISACTAAVGRMLSESGGSLSRLSEIQSHLSHTNTVSDLRALKVTLSNCLEEIAVEVSQHNRQSVAGLNALAQGAQAISRQSERLSSRFALDRATGLPLRGAAEAMLAEICKEETMGVAVMFVLRRVRHVMTRFGQEICDGLLQKLSIYLGSGVNPERGLYRWNGPALLAVLDRSTSFDRTRVEVQRLVLTIPRHEVTIGSRAAIIPVSVGWALFPVTHPVSAVVDKIEAFAKSQFSEDGYAS